MDGPNAAKLRTLPAVQTLLETAPAKTLLAAHGRPAVVSALQAVLEEARATLRVDRRGLSGRVDILEAATRRLAEGGSLVRVINATGIVLHTNLGRAPLAQQAIDAVVAAAGACCLEYDLQTGRRGSRLQAVEPLLCALSGAEAAVAVNNGAAAMLLAMSALAAGGEVIVSRGELIEIGGGFRIPDVIRQGGARLVEVGTTNKTRLTDYREAVSAETRMLLRVHPSNFRMVGFTEMVSRNALAGLGRELGLVTMEDLGSGALHNLRELGQPAEDLVQDVVSAGIDVVAFSGDKLLGGPQAGLLIGREPVITPMRRHPLMRALRLDKLSLAALEATLRLHRREDWAQIPALRMMAQNGVLLQRRAEKLAAQLGNLALIEASEGEAGGGTLPAQPIPSVAVTLKAEVSAECLSKRLRTGKPPVIGRIVRDRVWLDMLTVADADVDALSAAVLQACA